MCGIFASKDLNKFLQLKDLNAYRGQHSYSYSTYDYLTEELYVHKRGLGEFDDTYLDDRPYLYHIGHIQAPTTSSKGTDNIHPSKAGFSYLWHNGILKTDCIKRLQKEMNTDDEWDTALLNQWFTRQYDLSIIDGTFSCLRSIYGKMYIFRNEISPMFIDDDFSLSSVKFKDSKATEPNIAQLMDLRKCVMYNIKKFKTKENPYYFAEEAV